MKVVLVVPNFRWVDNDENALWHYLPYNLCLIASCIRDICEVSIIDAYKQNMTKDTLHACLKQLSPDVVGITVLMDKYGASGHIVARIAKELGAIVVIGGVYASMNADIVALDNNIDYVIKGEGEQSFKGLLENLKYTGIFPYRIIEAKRIENLDYLPLPAYDLINFRSYIMDATRNSVDAPSLLPYGRVLTSRGCSFGCCFCQVEKISGKKFRPRSPESVLDEIRWLKEMYGIRSLIFDDDNLLTDKERAKQIFQGMIDRGLVMPWKMIATAVFKLDTELIYLMKKSGCVYVDVALESGSERVLHKIINKPVDLNQAMEIVEELQVYGIFVAVNFIIGFPTETWDEIRETLAFADRLNADYTKIFTAIPLRNTRLWEMCEKGGFFKKDFTGIVEWSEGHIETKDFTPNELTILRAFEWDRINFTSMRKLENICRMMGISVDEMQETRKNTLSKISNSIRQGVECGV